MFREKGLVDVTLDEPLLRYLALGEEPHHPQEARRVIRASEYISMADDGSLWTTAARDSLERQIPPIVARKRIVEVTFKQGAYPSGEKLY